MSHYHININVIRKIRKKSYPVRGEHLREEVDWTQPHQLFNRGEDHTQLLRSLQASKEAERIGHRWSRNHSNYQKEEQKS